MTCNLSVYCNWRLSQIKITKQAGIRSKPLAVKHLPSTWLEVLDLRSKEILKDYSLAFPVEPKLVSNVKILQNARISK